MSVAVMVMEMCLVELVLGWLWVVLAGSPWPAPWVALLAAPLSLVGGRLVPFSWRRESWFDAAWWCSVAVVVAGLAELGNVYWPGTSTGGRWDLQFVAGLFLAWRGWSIAEGWIDRELVEAELQAGTVVMLVGLLILTWIAPGGGLLPAVIFVAAGLFGLGVARRSERRGPRSPTETDWLLLVGALVVLMVVAAVVMVALVTPELLVAMADQARVAGSLAIAGIAGLIHWFASLFPSFSSPPEIVPPQPSGSLVQAPSEGAPSESWMPPFWVFELLATFLGVMFLVILGRMLIRILRRGMRRNEVQHPREPKLGPPVSDAPPFSWRTWWAMLVAWFRGQREAEARAASTSTAGSQRAEAEAAVQRSVRALYREFLTVVSRAGFERQPSMTPSELARSLRGARPEAAGSVSTLTELYVRTRYGEEQVGREDISRMRSAVQRVRQELTARRTEPRTGDRESPN